jgi:periplasmic protein TonB
MFGKLIESCTVAPRRTGGSVASIIIHSVIITGGVMATARDVVTPELPPPIPVVVPYVRAIDPRPVAQQQPARVSVASVAAPFLPRLTMSAIIPDGIPPIDLTATPTPSDFRQGPIAGNHIVCIDDCRTISVTDSAGHQLWNTRDVMMRMLADPVPPRYPESLRRAGIEGEVVVQFVVDTTGRVDLRTVDVLRSTHDAFTTAVRETLAKLRFAPAIGGERKVRALAVMPFHFTLR